jgi:uncharacterized membrane protein
MTSRPVQHEPHVICPLCHQSRPSAQMVPGLVVRPQLQERIRSEHPEWTPDSSLCMADLHHYRLAHLQSLLEEQRGELSEMDREVVDSIRRNELIAENVSRSVDARMTMGARVADRVAAFGGSWPFIGIFGAIIMAWIGLNAFLLAKPAFDPYPFILLNLVLSCLAAVQAPVIMMSQNRQATRDRAHAEQDYRVNLKAELEIRLLHEKMDHLSLHQWQRLMEVQAIQADLLDELAARLDKTKA